MTQEIKKKELTDLQIGVICSVLEGICPDCSNNLKWEKYTQGMVTVDKFGCPSCGDSDPVTLNEIRYMKLKFKLVEKNKFDELEYMEKISYKQFQDMLKNSNLKEFKGYQNLREVRTSEDAEIEYQFMLLDFEYYLTYIL